MSSSPPNSSGNGENANPSGLKQYRGFALNPPRKRTSILQSQSSDELARNYLLSKMNHKIRSMGQQEKDSHKGHLAEPTAGIADVLSSHEKDRRRNSNLVMKKKDEVQRRRNIDAFSKFDNDYQVKSDSEHPGIPSNLLANNVSIPSTNPSADPLMTSLISRLKMAEEKVKTLEGNLRNKELELKRIRKLGRDHKMEGKAYRDRLGDLLPLLEGMASFLEQEIPDHPFQTEIENTRRFSKQFFSEGFKILESKIPLGSQHTELQPPDDEFSTQEVKIESKTINITLMQQRIDALNSTVTEDYEIVHTKDGMSKFKERKIVSLAFFSNGIVVDNGSFRPYEWDITKAFLIDIRDGYFPFEFKEKYPNGVRLQLIDKSTEKYTRLNAAQHEVVSGNIHSLDNLKEEMKHGAPNKKEFLENLPKQVIKDGKIINVRQNIASMLGDSLRGSNLDPNQKEVICQTQCYEEVTKCKESSISPPRHALIRLRLPKIANVTLETIIIHLYPDQTVADIRKEIDLHINPNGNINYSLRCWPNVRLEDNSKTVEEAGLVPNVNLFLHLL